MKKFFPSLLFLGVIIFSGCGSSTLDVALEPQKIPEEKISISSGELSPSVSSSTLDQSLDEIEVIKGIELYSNGIFSVKYPSGFTLEETQKKDFITLSNEKGKIQIGEFEPAAVPIPETEEQEEQFPKDIKYHGDVIASALFYKLDDALTMEQLQNIQKTIRVK